MSEGRIVELARRDVVAVGGPDAHRFIGDLITADLDRVATAGAAYGALLSPQGKILFDFIVMPDVAAEDERLLFDLPASLVADFMKRLGIYKLRAKVTIADLSEEKSVVALWGGEHPALDGPVARDPRLDALGFRAIVPKGAEMAAGHAEASKADYDAHRIACGIPEGGIDFAFGDVFPHDVDMDQLHGVAFDKGCYIGQEVVSRMEHRGTARRRFVIMAGDALPLAGTELVAGGKPIGTAGSSAGATGLALVRLDRAREAMDAGTPILAGGSLVTLSLPSWARFTWPGAAAATSET
jgi:folate-binding protein YgfZ